MTQVYLVLVPKSESRAALAIDPGSGIVTKTGETPRRIVYFEGNRFGASNLSTFEERVQCAAGRLYTNYPTIARGLFPASEFDTVGSLYVTDDADVVSMTMVIDNWAAVERWNGGRDG